MMRSRVVFVVLLTAVIGAVASAQQIAAPPNPPPDLLTRPYYQPVGPPSPLPPSAVPDLSGDWAFDNRPGRQSPFQSLSAADPQGARRGKEGDIPYHPWALDYTLKQVPPTGPEAKFELTSDPYIHACEPLGLARIYNYPAKTKFIQTPEAVYVLHEVGPAYRIVWLNAKHPEDPDPQAWGHSIGWYENGDTLVVDTVGVGDRSWLDQQGHPHTERLHMIERYRKVDNEGLDATFVIDDPAAYTAAWTGARKTFRKSTTGFLRYQWPCSVRDNYEHYAKVGAAGNSGDTSFKR